eukprot:CAMPEP_0198443252 /NCGR_PEP_ID=MMETSP1452-20131203/69998_1 /TAXON_ID=1181717 /ORGANISM="Synchroma pusillum, Strain CCMP3072" /LENGTH=153 /DNA_ID=CAMNT_0044163883 /DNA_START=47 /DNA_END=508 /DNA_ORIENTATION=+
MSRGRSPRNRDAARRGDMDSDEESVPEEEAQALLEEELDAFWAQQVQEMEELPVGTEQSYKAHNDLPLARIKRIMKSDEDVRMISAEAPVLFAKACEMFILELTLRSWNYSQRSKRRTLQKEDVSAAIRATKIFDFLVDFQEPPPPPAASSGP